MLKTTAIKTSPQQDFSFKRSVMFGLLLAMLPWFVSCYAAHRDAYRPQPDEQAAVVNPVSTQIFFYPTKGQTPEQQDRDRFECYTWAVKESGFDPSLASVPQQYRVTVVASPPPGHDTAVGAVAGAMIGAIAGGHHHAGEGALIGAGVGALAGAASDSSRQETAQRIEESKNAQNQARYAQYEKGAPAYRRAMTACLEGRGYSVK